jgi:tryptophanyl-tRNA synthetase
MKRLNSDPAYIDRVLVDGASRARAVASKNMAMVKDILGFVR